MTYKAIIRKLKHYNNEFFNTTKVISLLVGELSEHIQNKKSIDLLSQIMSVLNYCETVSINVDLTITELSEKLRIGGNR